MRRESPPGTGGSWPPCVDPDVENRVEYVGWATHSPSVDVSAGYGAVPAPDGWYVFRAVPVDLAPKAGA